MPPIKGAKRAGLHRILGCGEPSSFCGGLQWRVFAHASEKTVVPLRSRLPLRILSCRAFTLALLVGLMRKSHRKTRRGSPCWNHHASRMAPSIKNRWYLARMQSSWWLVVPHVLDPAVVPVVNKPPVVPHLRCYVCCGTSGDSASACGTPGEATPRFVVPHVKHPR